MPSSIGAPLSTGPSKPAGGGGADRLSGCKAMCMSPPVNGRRIGYGAAEDAADDVACRLRIGIACMNPIGGSMLLLVVGVVGCGGNGWFRTPDGGSDAANGTSADRFIGFLWCRSRRTCSMGRNEAAAVEVDGEDGNDVADALDDVDGDEGTDPM